MKFQNDTYWKNTLNAMSTYPPEYEDETQEIRNAILNVVIKLRALVRMQEQVNGTDTDK